VNPSNSIYNKHSDWLQRLHSSCIQHSMKQGSTDKCTAAANTNGLKSFTNLLQQ